MTGEPARPIRFGAFEVDLAARELRKSGVRIRVQEQPFRVLAMLLARPGKVVTRDELQQELWPDEEYGEFDLGLNTAVKKLRQALGDSATHPRFIETVPKVGYKFVGQIAGGPSTKPQEPTGAPRNAAWMPAAAAAALLIGGLGYWIFGRPSSPPLTLDPTRLTEKVLTRYQGAELSPSFSPDCAQFAYSWRKSLDENYSVYVETVESGRPSRLTSGQALVRAPSWSPDGRSIAFVRTEGTDFGAPRQLLVMPALGGDQRKLLDFNGYYSHDKAAWSPDGRLLAFAARKDGQAPSRLASVPVQGGDPEWLTSPDVGLIGDDMPAFSPDGSRLAFVRRAGMSSGWNIHALPLTDDYHRAGDPLRLTNFTRKALAPVWMPDGKSLLFLGEQGAGQEGIWSIAASGQAQPRLIWRLSGIKDGFPNSSLAVCQDPAGRILVAYASPGQPDADIFRVELDGPGKGQAIPVIQTTTRDTNVRHSPDGSSIAYLSGRPYRDIWVADADGGNPRQMTQLESRIAGPLSWSPDGRRVAGHFRHDGPADIYWVDVESRELKRLIDHPADDAVAVWSRDGRWIYFSSNRTGDYRPWRALAGGSKPQQLLPWPCPTFEESLDRRFLYFNLRDGSLYQASLTPGMSPDDRAAAAKKILAIDNQGLNAFRVSAGGIYYSAGRPSSTRTTGNILHRFDPRTGKVEDLIEFDGYFSSIAPDESHILTVYGEYSGVDLKLLEPLE